MAKIHALTNYHNGIANQIVTDVEIKNIVTGDAFKTKGIWDTGATNTVITEFATKRLKLHSVGMAKVQGVHEIKTVNKFFINVTLNNKNVSLDLAVTEGKQLSPDNSINLLIGMDIINKGDFAITNFQGLTKMTFRVPSIQDIDFVKGIKKSKPVISDRLPSRNSLCPCGSGKKYKHCCGKRA